MKKHGTVMLKKVKNVGSGHQQNVKLPLLSARSRKIAERSFNDESTMTASSVRQAWDCQWQFQFCSKKS